MPPDRKLAEARTALGEGRYDEAIALIGAVIAETNDEDVILFLAETFEVLGLKAEAAEVFEHLAGRQPAARTDLLARAARLRTEAASPGDADGMQADDDPVDALIASGELDQLRQAMRRIGSDIRDTRNLALFRQLRALLPDDPYIRTALLGFAREFCDYPTLEAEEPALKAEIEAGRLETLQAETPLYNLMWCADEALNRQTLNVSDLAAPPAGAGQTRRAMPHAWGDRIRIGYLSNDFWDDHATMRLFQSVLTAHDPARFDVTLFCYTRERFIGFDGGNRRGWGRIVRIEALDDEAAVAAMRAQGVDILVDLKGHTGGSRSRLMNRPVAPIHVQWLGFPGSCVNIDCDYVIGDRFVLPDGSKRHYHEKFCRLPESYQPNDPVFRVLPAPLSRAGAGLPDDRFVFSAFNSQRKNSLEGTALWARVLRANPQALLWLMVDGEEARRATLARFERLGIAGAQILFAPKMAYEPHLARAQAADLGLDSVPYNGHTTTSDMLWAGLPVITRKGSNFASRVSESLLNAIDLPELVAADDDGFVALATALAREPARLADIRKRLADNRYGTPLFDSERFCRHLEAAFETMVERARAGLAPDHFDGPALPR